MNLTIQDAKDFARLIFVSLFVSILTPIIFFYCCQYSIENAVEKKEWREGHFETVECRYCTNEGERRWVEGYNNITYENTGPIGWVELYFMFPVIELIIMVIFLDKISRGKLKELSGIKKTKSLWSLYLLYFMLIRTGLVWAFVTVNSFYSFVPI